MAQNLRKNVRFLDFGRAECEALCPVAGILDDISKSGCKIHYDAPVNLNMENDYEIHIRLSRENTEPFVLYCHPQWQKESADGTTEIGFSFLHSPDSAKLESYIKQLSEENYSSDFDSLFPQETSCQFV
ncbi:PilZ domain-containing protein [Treponema pectinovorum]|uniref:PilZ domain-containing protein n=1 Tax=Treponema pectinovorum TaxID=164 RepID=UPI0011C7D58B|nr:PilZ domain-containing protein [Treponema pectinovorum]